MPPCKIALNETPTVFRRNRSNPKHQENAHFQNESVRRTDYIVHRANNLVVTFVELEGPLCLPHFQQLFSPTTEQHPQSSSQGGFANDVPCDSLCARPSSLTSRTARRQIALHPMLEDFLQDRHGFIDVLLGGTTVPQRNRALCCQQAQRDQCN